MNTDNDAYLFSGDANVARSYGVNGLNQYTSAGSATFTYDANGNLTGDGLNTYTYDIENRLIGRSGGAEAALFYDPLGRLAATNGAPHLPGSGAVTRFLYDSDALVAEYERSTATYQCSEYSRFTGVFKHLRPCPDGNVEVDGIHWQPLLNRRAKL